MCCTLKVMPQKVNKTPVSSQTASSHMLTKVPIGKREDSVSKILSKLAGESWDLINWVWVVNEKRKLIGMVPIEKLVSQDGGQALRSLMIEPKVRVKSDTDQERVAILAIQHDMRVIPVVDDNDHLLGIVPSEKIIDILHQEHIEDFLRVGGIQAKGKSFLEILSTRVVGVVSLRLPWLIVGLVGGIIATLIVRFFEASLREEIALAFFIPVIAYMADAIGTQTETIFVRTLTLTKLSVGKYLAREVSVGGLIGLICGVLLFLFAYFWLSSFDVGLIAGLSLFIAMTIASALATLTPFVFYLLGKDPAIGSGPLTTIIQDIVSLIIYFTVAVLVLS